MMVSDFEDTMAVLVSGYGFYIKIVFIAVLAASRTFSFTAFFAIIAQR